MAARARAHVTRRVTVEQKWPDHLSDRTAVPVGPVTRVDSQGSVTPAGTTHTRAPRLSGGNSPSLNPLGASHTF